MRGDNPQAYIAGDRRRALAAALELDPAPFGTALFADISGFTPLTEALASELGPKRGAEEIGVLLDTAFSALLEVLHEHGGSVLYFSGDAVTCWLDDPGPGAARCALLMQQAMTEVATISTPGGKTVTLGLKISLDTGRVRRFVVGDPTVQRIDVLAGSLMDSLADAERHAAPGEVVLAAGALAALRARADTGPRTGRPGSPDEVRVLRSVPPTAAPPAPRKPLPQLPDAVVRQWLLPAVYERMVSGHGEFLADLRPATPLFIRFAGIDFDVDPDAPARLDEFVTAAQRIVDAHGGNVLQLTIGDKGASLYAVFGAPIAHGDDAARACRAAAELLGLEGVGGTRAIQVGISRGRLRSGTYGHPERRTFCCLGDAVNVAARLMMAAPEGAAYMTGSVVRAAGGSINTRPLPPLQVKGKTLPLEVAALRIDGGGDDGAVPASTRLPFVGRTEELAALVTLADRAASGSGQVVVVAGDAGVGKTRLITQLLDEIGDRFTVSRGKAQTFGVGTLYTGWNGVFSDLLRVEPGTPLEHVLASLETRLTDLDATLLPRLPLLGPVLGLSLPDSALTAALGPRLRKASLEATLVRCLTVLAHRSPLAVVLEDAHGLEALGRDLLAAVVRACRRLPLLVILATRPPAPGAGLVAAGPGRTTMALGDLDAASAALLVDAKLAALGGADREVSPALARMLRERGQGNPFYLQELLNYLHDQGISPRDDAAVAALDIPDSLQSLVLSRVDALPEAPRRVLKVASVVGTSFDPPILVGTYPELGPEAQVLATLNSLNALALTLGPDPQEEYRFFHAVTADVTYDSLPFGLRSELHGMVSRWIEQQNEDSLDRVLDLLAYHYGRSPDEAKKREYFVRAGIAAQEAYANEAAAAYFDRALPLVDDSERGGLLLRVGRLRELRGAWGDAEAIYAEALALARTREEGGAEAAASVALAEVARKQSRFEQAQDWLTAARAAFTTQGDDAVREAGLGRVLHLEGTLASQQARYPQARALYQSSLAIRTRLGDQRSIGALLSNLALVAECLGEYDVARTLNDQALNVREGDGDRAGVAVSRNNLGMLAQLGGSLAQAREHFEESMRLAGEVGDEWLQAVGHHNLGNVHRGLGTTVDAGGEYLQAYAFYLDSADRWSLALLAEDVALLAVALHRFEEAVRLDGVALAIRDQLDAPRAPSLAEELTAGLAPAVAATGGAGVGLNAQEERSDDLDHLMTAVCGQVGISGAVPYTP